MSLEPITVLAEGDTPHVHLLQGITAKFPMSTDIFTVFRTDQQCIGGFMGNCTQHETRNIDRSSRCRVSSDRLHLIFEVIQISSPKYEIPKIQAKTLSVHENICYIARRKNCTYLWLKKIILPSLPTSINFSLHGQVASSSYSDVRLHSGHML